MMGIFILLAVGSLDWRPERPESPPKIVGVVQSREALRAGAGRATLDLPPDVPLAGYRPFGRAPTEPGDGVHARSLLLEAGDVKVALVLLEQMTVPSNLVTKIETVARASGASCTVVVGSHSHSGPGGYDSDFVPQVAIGRFDERVERAILDGVATSLAAARSDLAPVTLAWSEKDTEGLNSNRDDRERPVDTRLGRLRFSRLDGRPVATLLRFSAHPTLTPRSIGPSGDWPGVTMERIESEGGVAFVLPGAVGDARVAKGAGGGRELPRVVGFGELVAEESRTLADVPLTEPIALACATAEFSLPPPDLGRMVPWALGPIVSNLVSPWAPEVASVAALRLGDVIFAAVPAEPLFDVGAAIEAGWERETVRVVGTGQGYVGYTPDAPAWEAGAPSAANAWFGTALGPRLERAAETVIRAVLDEEDVGTTGAIAVPWPD